MRFSLLLAFLLGTLAVSMPPAASAQWTTDLGANLGISWAALSADGADGRTAFEGGVTARVEPPAGPVSLRSGLFFSQKGTAVDIADGGGEVQYSGNYVQLPLVLHAQGPSIRIVTPYLQAGGFGAVKIFERQSTGGDGLRIPVDTDESFFQRTDAGLLLGVGAELLLGERPLGVTLRHARGLVDVAQDFDDPVFENAPFPSTAETRTWTLSVELGL
jgi:hypothetical protein